MIRLGDIEKAKLEGAFKTFTDRDIIRELVRRGRLRQAQASTMFWSEMRSDERYMEVVRDRLLMSCARAIADNENVKPALISEMPDAPRLVGTELQRPPGDTRLTADIVFLVARDKAEG